MITTTLSFAMHILVSSYRVLQPIKQILEYVLPISSRNMANSIQWSANFNEKHLKRGKVPSIEIKEDVCIYESLVTVEYLDDVYPQRPLLSKDPVTRAYDKIIAQTSGTLHSIFFKSVKDPDAITEDNIISYKNTLYFLQDQLKERDSVFFGGKEPGYADYMVWPWFERLLVCQKREKKLEIDSTVFKLLNDYISNMLKDAAVQQYLIPEEIYLEIFKSYNLGEVPNYNLLKE